MTEREVQVIELGRSDRTAAKRVLNTGSGAYAPERLHAVFRKPNWTEVRLDIDRLANPDIIGSTADLEQIGDASFDAIWCSHNLEHLHTHEVPEALVGFRRVLKADGFALITTPDLEAIAELVVNGRLEETAYQSPAGPIRALDMLFGLSTAIAAGSIYMAHNTGFTTERLGRLLIEAGFFEVLTKRGNSYDLWALALMPECGHKELLLRLRENQLDLFPDTP
jgi:predicted SAM-dependent methyltransferase